MVTVFNWLCATLIGGKYVWIRHENDVYWKLRRVRRRREGPRVYLEIYRFKLLSDGYAASQYNSRPPDGEWLPCRLVAIWKWPFELFNFKIEIRRKDNKIEESHDFSDYKAGNWLN